MRRLHQRLVVSALVIVMMGVAPTAVAYDPAPTPLDDTASTAAAAVPTHAAPNDRVDGLRTDIVASNAESAAAVADVLGVPVEDGSATEVASAAYVLPSGLTRVDQYVGEQFVEEAGAPAGPDRWAAISP